ncbi:hypothetical protein BgiMline_015683 [Biomphalaria glabrata]
MTSITLRRSLCDDQDDLSSFKAVLNCLLLSHQRPLFPAYPVFQKDQLQDSQNLNIGVSKDDQGGNRTLGRTYNWVSDTSNEKKNCRR